MAEILRKPPLTLPSSSGLTRGSIFQPDQIVTGIDSSSVPIPVLFKNPERIHIFRHLGKGVQDIIYVTLRQ